MHIFCKAEDILDKPKIVDLLKILSCSIKECFSLTPFIDAPKVLLFSKNLDDISPLEAISNQIKISSTRDSSLQPLSLQELALSAVTLGLVRLWILDSQLTSCILDDTNNIKSTAWLSITCTRLAKTLKRFHPNAEDPILASVKAVKSATIEEQQFLLSTSLHL